MRAVEDAIARQVYQGGNLATNLLELAALREDVLMPLVAESLGLEAAPPGRLALPSADVMRFVPGELGLRHGMFPLALRERALVVAVAEPLPPAVEDDLGFALDLAIHQVVAPLVRIRQALSEGYGIPLDRRYLRLVAKLDGRVDPSPSAMPPAEVLPPMKMPQSVSIPSPTFGTGVPSSEPDIARLEQRPATKTPFVAHPADYVNPSIPRSPPVPSDAAPFHPEPPGDDPGLRSSEPGPEPAAAPSVEAVKPRGATRALAGVLRKALLEERALAPVDKTKAAGLKLPSGTQAAWKAAPARRKGPFTAAMAEQELEEAGSSDAVLDVLFAFAQQFFEMAALFVVHGDLAEGRSVHGPGADRGRVAGIGVPLDLPSSLARARERRAPVIGKLDPDGLDAELARDLGRGQRSAARSVALLPVVVRGRAVAILYGDDGDADVELGALGDLISIIGLAGAALERIALRKKLGGRAPEIPLKVRIQDGAAALARAISTSAADAVALGLADARERPPTLAARTPAVSPTTPAGPDPAPPVEPPPTAREGSSPSLERAGRGRGGATRVEPFAANGGASPEAAVVMFASTMPGAPEPSGEFAVSPPENENPLATSPGPRTARYFDDQPPVRTSHTTDPGIGSIPFPEVETSPDGAVSEPAITAVPGAEAGSGGPESFHDLMESNPPPGEPADPAPAPASVPLGVRPTLQMERPVMRRGPAPLYEGRQAAVPEGASVEWVGAPEPEGPRPRERTRTLPSMGFEPLPLKPPPNATSWTSFPSQPPVASGPASPSRRRSERPIPREDADEEPTRRLILPPEVRMPSLPSVLVDVGAEHEELIQRVVDGGRGSQEAFGELVRAGEVVIQAVMARFPGPLRVDRHRPRTEVPAASQCGPILELVVAIRRPALPFVSVRGSSAEAEVRFWATHVLGELRYPEAATVLVPRLFDDDVSVQRIARRSAAALVFSGSAGGPILKGLEDIMINRDQPRPHRLLAIETMGEIRSGSMVPPLLAALSDPSEPIVDAARKALVLVTRQDFGVDLRRWQDWWGKNGARHRIEWLVDALMHEDPLIRRAAGDELKSLTKEYFGYYDDLPKRERERAQGLYRAWWEREGRQRFG